MKTDQPMDEEKYLKQFETELLKRLEATCQEYGFLEGKLPMGEDIDRQWEVLAQPYMADAVPEIREYPLVSLAWAMYLGLAVAHGWDTDWEHYSTAPYATYYGENGFDDMDEHIVRDLLGLPLESEAAQELEKMVRRCGQLTLSLIRREGIEPQSPTAFRVYACSVYALYRIGAAMQLYRMGYKMERFDL